ncbi:MAG: hydroxymethylglutaryl-CoA lyase [Alicycliphilus sp.]|jgi:hydroxymethylglutaryl-CoA lyase|uniref:Hydroxymethylglutaryl-CoA lyase n=1 Tax=Diaphorobacter limosus TaxID=3036128 RepID=A0ABZ0J5Y3_9BURK|nr:hydroxymethylglutaryl-CoA lyase [Diaphorobacter sp. Y-1]MBP7326862.1 hydroxymethylglutaryl-CoA lyase [Alicycliphilus sp.]MBP8779489.1 hydroxymethylglutaryl-CoA lyase [Alicycliphilus sp.]WOO32741.1 hydroxymethylglutaryl-CoA lyase [Diaphorobacter sp. Y-1]HRO53642.1 hydroxymethylglutaryl-CoA lyase [Alicycliphilus sp.]HRP21274.1 hydroxymethylglutaryl-CoA lyase [Alicycliphilus sp.]
MSAVWNGAGRRISICDVGLRDGLQMEARFVPTEDKIALVHALSAAGLRKIEVTSFTSPNAIPALRDAEVVMRNIERHPGVTYTALVPNARGAERAIESRVDELNLVMSVSGTHNLANLRMTSMQSFAALSQVVAMAQGAGVPVNVSLSCVFGCPMEGDVALSTVCDWVRRFADLGVRRITLCDTTGMAYPTQVAQVSAAALARWPDAAFTLHFHNTRGMGLANVLAAIDAGASRFDASLGGLGGCPYAPGASGNVSTEDLVHALELMGYDTGIDLPALLAAAHRLPEVIGHDLPSQLAKAGPRLALHPAPADLDALRERALARSAV